MNKNEIVQQIISEKTYFYFKFKRNLILDLIQKYSIIDRKSCILEIGPGRGVLISEFKTLFKDAQFDVVEPNKEFHPFLIKIVRKIYPFCLEHLKISKKQKYDVIVMLDVLEHIKDDASAIRKIKTLLKKDGYLILTIPANKFLYSYHDMFLGHYRRYSKKEIVSLLKRNGFRIVFASFYNTVFFLPVIVLRKILSKLFRPKRSDTNRLAIFNPFLYFLCSVERILIKKVPLPFGLGIIIISQKV